jgi:hypothetical protein
MGYVNLHPEHDVPAGLEPIRPWPKKPSGPRYDGTLDTGRRSPPVVSFRSRTAETPGFRARRGLAECFTAYSEPRASFPLEWAMQRVEDHAPAPGEHQLALDRPVPHTTERPALLAIGASARQDP